MLRFLRRCLSMAALTIALASSSVMTQTLPTQNWPTRPITLVVPFAAGSASDTVGRILAARLSEVLGQQVVVENIGGAGGMNANARAPPPPPGAAPIFALRRDTIARRPTLYP